MISIQVANSLNLINVIRAYFVNYVVDGTKFTLTSNRDMKKRDKEKHMYVNHIYVGFFFKTESIQLSPNQLQ